MRWKKTVVCPMQPEMAPQPVSFSDLFAALGTEDLTYGEGARSLSGRHVVIEGFLSHAHGPDRSVSLTSEPGVCADCSAAPVPVIALPDLRLVPREGEGTVRISGRLDFGLKIAGGTASMLRIEDAAIIETADLT
jgi:hypothetical protein